MEKEFKTFIERQQEFQEELAALEKKHYVMLYSANMMVESGEVFPLIRIRDNFNIEIVDQKNDKTKKADSSNKKT